MIAEVIFGIPLNRSFYYSVPDKLESSVRPGLRITASFGPRKAVGLIVSLLENREADNPDLPSLKPLISVLDKEPVFEENFHKVLLDLSSYYMSPPGLAFSAFYNFPRKAEFEKKGAESRGNPDFPSLPPLEGEKKEAFEKARNILDSGPSEVLLWGPPKSGKTDIFINLMAREIMRGGQVLYLMPDIRLADIYRERFKSFFPDGIFSVWHSDLPPARKNREWNAVYSGKARIIIGSRSAAMLPFARLKLAIIDEEQDEMYKQEEKEPHFHVRRLLEMRTANLGSSLLLGSSCPCAETFHRAREGRLKTVEIKGGAGKFGVEIIDSGKYPGEIITPPLKNAVERALAGGGKVLVIVNRRGHSFFVRCLKCGWRKKCPRCSATMMLKKEGSLKRFYCRRCSATDEFSEKCPSCKEELLVSGGVGTEKMEEEILRLFPGRGILRLDGFSKSKGLESEISGADIILGTRILSRGYNFPGVSLAAIVGPERDINPYDFRSDEKIFQLLVAASGRLSGENGTLLIQTREPGYRIFHYFSNMDYKRFMDEELKARKEFNSPPFSLTAKILFSGTDRKAVKNDFISAGETLMNFSGGDGGDALRFSEIARRRPKSAKIHYYAFIVKGADENVRAAVGEIMKKKTPRKVKVRVYIDPYYFR